MILKLGNFKCEFFGKETIGGSDNPLLIRYTIFRFPKLGLYIHKLLRSDFERALHDHPWSFISIVLKNGYNEVHDQTQNGKETIVWNGPGSVLLRPAQWRHRVVIPERWDVQEGKYKPVPATTLVIVGQRTKKWGFFLPEGWCWWRKHNPQLNICEEKILVTAGSD